MKNIQKIVFIPLFAFAMALLGLTSCKSTKTAAGKTNATETVSMKTSAQCGSCRTRIEGVLNAVKGVKSASVNLDTGMTTV